MTLGQRHIHAALAAGDPFLAEDRVAFMTGAQSTRIAAAARFGQAGDKFAQNCFM